MKADTITILGFVLGILGLIATLVGNYFTYISFINPIKRFSIYLKRTDKWEEFQHVENNITVYRYKNHPEFQIIINWNKVIVESFGEEWINDDLYPDKTNNASYYVQLRVGSMLAGKEMFVTLDGHRYFVPVPKIMVIKKNERTFYYEKLQLNLAKIVGKFHHDQNMEKFISNCKVEIGVKP